MTKTDWTDISLTIKSGMMHWPQDPPVHIKRIKDINKGEGANVSFLSFGSHSGTHIDAPLHFIKNAKGVDKMPFQAVVGPARVLAIKDRRVIREPELRGCRIEAGERIIFKTLNSSYWKTKAFQKEFVYISPEAAEYLASLKVRAIGADYLSVGGYHKDGGQTHKILLGAGIWIIEGLNLSKVKPGDYDLICLPLKIFNSDGAPARAIIRSRARKRL